MKIFISQPMGGKTDEQIEIEREQVVQKLRDKYGDIEILDTIFDLGEGVSPLVYLAKSIEVLAQADVISVHMPYIKDVNYHMINDEFIAKMKDGAILINTARGEVQDIDAIVRAVESGKLGGFGTDVLEGESAVFFKDLNGQALENETHQKLIDL